ncbi:MAG: response regulator transcription factor [Betaproteobacteria bacterium]|jgi:two-component system response regulator AlgR|nr:MAG: response regulator transcription factor [Betaproteobacteria bacterium]
MAGAELRIAITDDEALARNRLRSLLEDIAEMIPIEVVGEAENGQRLLELLQRRPADVVLLDIRMPEMDGLETARHLQKLDDPPHVVFTTAYDDYAISAFELHAIDYLVKPIRLRRLNDALARARSITRISLDVLSEIAGSARTHLSVHERGKVQLVPVADILYLRAELKYVTIRTEQRELVLEESLSRLEKEFRDRFVRIHRNCLVAKDRIESFERESYAGGGEARWVVRVRCVDEALPVSRRQQPLIRQLGKKNT